MLNGSSILITGGTGSFGHAFVPMTLAKYNPRRLVIFSRDEMKHWEMAKIYGDDSRVRFFIGDVRDKERLSRALKGIDFVVHAAATKIVPTAETDPFEGRPDKVYSLFERDHEPGHARIRYRQFLFVGERNKMRNNRTARPHDIAISDD